MSILTRYIARLYLVNFITLLVVLFSFVVTVDVIVNLSRFMRQAAEAAGPQGGSALRQIVMTFVLVIHLWGPRLLQLFAYLNGLVMVLAMGFTCAQLIRHREFVATLASGISLHALARPFLLVALLLTAVQAIVQEVALPPIAHLLNRDAGDAGRTDVEAIRVDLARDASGRLWHAAAFNDADGTLERVTVWERDARSRLTRIITAARARWDGRGWELEGGRATPPPSELVAGGAAPRPSDPVERLDSDLDPTLLKVLYLQGFGQNLSWARISSMLAAHRLDERAAASLDRVRWGRLSGWCINLITLWGALSIFLIKEPRPMLWAALRVAPVALLGFAATALSSAIGVPGLPVWAGAFIPALALLSIALALFSGIDT